MDIYMKKIRDAPALRAPGRSGSTLRRRLKAFKLRLSRRLLSPRDQNAIRRALGFPPYDWDEEGKNKGGGSGGDDDFSAG